MGKPAVLPIIVVRFHRSTVTILGKWKLTALKTSIRVAATAAASGGDNGKRRPTNGRIDPGALVGVGVASVEAVSMEGAVVAGKGTRSCKSGKKESRDDF